MSDTEQTPEAAEPPVGLPCDSYCEHGGVCILDLGHEGLHDSRYCQWDDARGMTKDAADAILIATDPVNGPTIAALDGLLRVAIDEAS